MFFQPLTELKPNKSKIRLIATDMDGTLTQSEKFTPKLLQALETLAKANFPLLIITGRSAGWVEGIYHYLPILGAIAENGGVFYGNHQQFPTILTSIADLSEHRQQLYMVFQYLQTFYPQLQESSDNRYRLTDWTFSVEGLKSQEIEHLKALTEEKGYSFTYSTVQCHLKLPTQDKATGLKQVLNQYFAPITPQQVLTLGDSPNDDPLFNRDCFPFSVGVANLLTYQDKLTYKPAYVTQKPEVEGFCEVVSFLL